jgi:hypothetical protein
MEGTQSTVRICTLDLQGLLSAIMPDRTKCGQKCERMHALIPPSIRPNARLGDITCELLFPTYKINGVTTIHVDVSDTAKQHLSTRHGGRGVGKKGGTYRREWHIAAN